jgi:broad specificity phosphatase PhoE
VRLLLVRHGESTWNAEGRYQGQRDVPLSPLGVRQAAALAQRLASDDDVRPRAIASSPLARARETAAPAARALGLEVDVSAGLIEISHGEWEGLFKPEIESTWPSMVAAWRTTPESVRFPGGESLDDVRTRWRQFARVVERYPSPLLVVTHDVIIRLAVLDARGEPLSAFNSLAAENAAITEIDYDSPKLHLVRLNDGSHLGDLRVDPAAQSL